MDPTLWKAVGAAMAAGLFHFLVAYAKYRAEAKKEKVEGELDRVLQIASETKDTSELEMLIRNNRNDGGTLY